MRAMGFLLGVGFGVVTKAVVETRIHGFGLDIVDEFAAFGSGQSRRGELPAVEQVMTCARSITVRPHRFNKDDGYIIEMPTPRRAGECFFLAIVRKGDGAIDYLTLERTDDDGVMLCGWNAEGGHINHGDRSTRDRDGFIAEVIALRLCSPKAAPRA